MKRSVLALLTAVFYLGRTIAQTDSIPAGAIPKMVDGIYLTYQDFRKYKPVTKEQISSKIDKTQLEFMGKVMFEEKVTFTRNDSLLTVPTKSAWGFFQNSTLYINYKDEFYRVPVFGSISYLVANVTVIGPGFYDPRFGGAGGSVATKEIREFVMNFYDGVVRDFTVETFEELLSRDAELFTEYSKLGRRKKKDELYRFIRRYNERHPVFFLK